MVCLLLCFIRSAREGDWNLHLACIRDMFPLDVRLWSHQLLTIPTSLLVWHDLTHRCTPFYAQIFPSWQLCSSTFRQCIQSSGRWPDYRADYQQRYKIERVGLQALAWTKDPCSDRLITSHERVVITQACRQMAGLSATNEECVRKEKGKIKDVSWWTWCQESTVHS